jgi:hypothetical protein
MTPEERDIIGRFIARVGGGGQAGSSFGSAVPATQTALPPIDPEADQFIASQFSAYREAPYRITQMAFVQEAALAEAQNRIKRLEYDLQQARAQAQAAPPPGQSRGFLGGLFGGGQQQTAPPPQYAPPPPQPTYPSGYQPGMFQRSGGSGFLGSALTTAAGVAGGVLAADAITSMFEGGRGGFGGGGFGGGMGGGWGGGGEVVNETVVNNYGDAATGGGDPWSGPGAADPAAGGGDPWGGAGAADPGGDAWSGAGGGDAGGGDWGGGGGDSGGGWDDSGGGDSGGF